MTDIILDAMDVTNVEKESSLKRRRLEEDEATEVDSSSKPKAKKAQTLSIENDEKIVLVLGASQSGKSTFLKRVHKFAEQRVPTSLHIGNGNTSTTLTTSPYPLIIEERPCSGVPKVGGDDTAAPSTPTGILRHTDPAVAAWKANKAFRFVRGSKGKVFKIRWFDTPGLNDSSNKDDANALEILSTLSQYRDVKKVHAVIFVTTGSFGGAFQKIFEYYQAMFPQLKDNFIILHTNWQPFDHKPEACVQRIATFDTLFHHPSKHFFIDSLPEMPEENADHKLALTNNILCEIFNVINEANHVELTDLTYPKSNDVKAIDSRMSIPLKEKIQKAHVRLHEIIKDTNDLEFLLQQKLKEHGKVSAKLASLQEELFGMDSSSHIEISRSNVISWDGAVFSQQQAVEVSASLPIYATIGVITEGYRHCHWAADEVIAPNERSARRTLHSQPFRGASGELVAYTSKKMYYADRIAELKRLVESTTMEIRTLDADIAKIVLHINALANEKLELETFVKEALPIIANLDADRCSIVHAGLLLKFYADANLNSADLLVRYLHILDKTLIIPKKLH